MTTREYTVVSIAAIAPRFEVDGCTIDPTGHDVAFIGVDFVAHLGERRSDDHVGQARRAS